MPDPDYITEIDMADPPYVDCEWGYAGCTGADYITDMVSHDDGWMCPVCNRTAIAEHEEDLRAWRRWQ